MLLYIAILLFSSGLFFILGRHIGEKNMSEEYNEYIEKLMFTLEIFNSKKGNFLLEKIKNSTDDTFKDSIDMYCGALTMKQYLDKVLAKMIKTYIVQENPSLKDEEKYISYKKEQIAELKKAVEKD